MESSARFRPPAWQRYPIFILLAGFVALFGLLVATENHQIGKGNVGAFGTYYAATVAMHEGRNPYGQTGSYPYVYPPLFAFLCQPLALLSRPAAARVMLAITCALVVTSLLIGSRCSISRLGRSPSVGNVLCVALAAALIAIAPIQREFLSLQSDAVVLLSFVLAIGWLDEQPILAGLALALGISIKYVPTIAIPYLLLRRRWKAAAATVIGTVFLAILPAFSLGWSKNLNYFLMANSGLGNVIGVIPQQNAARVHPLTDPLNVSVTSSMARLAAASGWKERTSFLMAAAIFCAWCIFLMDQYRSRHLPVLRWPREFVQRDGPFRGMIAVEWASLMIAAMAFSPNGELLLAVFPAIVLATLLCWRPAPSSWKLPTGLLLTLIALILPIALIGHQGTHRWDAAGMPCWLLLVSWVALFSPACDAYCGSSLRPEARERQSVTNHDRFHSRY